MIYDLTNIYHRKQFAKRANALLSKDCRRVELTDISNRTLNQNRYLHVLLRIMAMETGVSEEYSKDIYFKTLVNPHLFVKKEKNPVTQEEVTVLRSTADLSISDMSNAIKNFLHWAADNGFYLPEASTDSENNIIFASDKDRLAFEQAESETERIINNPSICM